MQILCYFSNKKKYHYFYCVNKHTQSSGDGTCEFIQSVHPCLQVGKKGVDVISGALVVVWNPGINGVDTCSSTRNN